MSSGRSVGERPVSLLGALRRGCFPHQLSWALDNRLRRWLIAPATVADRLPIAPHSRILEVGPGSGYFSRELLARVPAGRLELLDLQPEMLAKAVAKFGDPVPANLGWTAADASGPLPFADASFDIVLLVAVLGELPDGDAAMRSFRRVLRPGGTLAFHEHVPDPDRIEPQALRDLAERHGFTPGGTWGPRWNYTALFEKPLTA